jgi:hypothetical protein
MEALEIMTYDDVWRCAEPTERMHSTPTGPDLTQRVCVCVCVCVCVREIVCEACVSENDREETQPYLFMRFTQLTIECSLCVASITRE